MIAALFLLNKIFILNYTAIVFKSIGVILKNLLLFHLVLFSLTIVANDHRAQKAADTFVQSALTGGQARCAYLLEACDPVFNAHHIKAIAGSSLPTHLKKEYLDSMIPNGVGVDNKAIKAALRSGDKQTVAYLQIKSNEESRYNFSLLDRFAFQIHKKNFQRKNTL